MQHTKGIIIRLSEIETLLKENDYADLADDLDIEVNESTKVADLVFDDDPYCQKWNILNNLLYDEYGFCPLNIMLLNPAPTILHLYKIVD